MCKLINNPAGVALSILLMQCIFVVLKPGLAGNWISPLLVWMPVFFALFFTLRWSGWRSEDNVSGHVPNRLLSGIRVALLLFIASSLFRAYDITNAMQSDVIPTVRILGERLLSGQPVYVTITEFGYILPPTYLPMHWLPFVPVLYVPIDLRIWALLLFFLLSLPAFLWLSKRLPSARLSDAFFQAPILLVLLFLFFQSDDAGYSVEWLYAGYYLLLVYGLLKESAWICALALVCILLSRFSLVLWLPVLPLWFWMKKGWKPVAIAASVVIAGVVLIYVLPFLSRYPESFGNAQAYYTKGALMEWDGQDWQKPGDHPYQISRGLGMAWWFYRLVPGSLPDRIFALKMVHAGGAILLGLLFSFFQLRQTFSHVPSRVFLLGSLHAYLWYFYSFIQVPYPYLFIVPLTVSIAWVALLYAWQAAPETPESE
jgi:hypothetical protein